MEIKLNEVQVGKFAKALNQISHQIEEEDEHDYKLVLDQLKNTCNIDSLDIPDHLYNKYNDVIFNKIFSERHLSKKEAIEIGYLYMEYNENKFPPCFLEKFK